MLSEDIAAMANRIEEHAHTGLHVDPHHVEIMVANLHQFARNAEQLERNTRPVAELGGTAPFAIPADGIVVRLKPVQ